VISVIGAGNQRKPPTLPQVTDKLDQIILYGIHLTWVGFEFITLVVIGTDCIGSCKSNFHMITIMTASPDFKENYIRYSWKCSNFNTQYTVNSEVLVHLKNIENSGSIWLGTWSFSWNNWRVNTTFNNTCILVILWWSVLLVEETIENHQPATSHW
jgi:hypothetical protein